MKSQKNKNYNQQRLKLITTTRIVTKIIIVSRFFRFVFAKLVQ
jgi:hypothetical protein